jgi:hypothetical protein
MKLNDNQGACMDFKLAEQLGDKNASKMMKRACEADKVNTQNIIK